MKVQMVQIATLTSCCLIPVDFCSSGNTHQEDEEEKWFVIHSWFCWGLMSLILGLFAQL